MPSRSLATALKDFGAPSRPSSVRVAAPPSFAMPEMDLPAFADFPAMEPIDSEALVAEAVAAAEAALRERLEQEHAEALENERKRHAEELAEFQNQFADDASAKILAGFEEMENRVVELTSAVTARILGVVLSDDVRERSIQRLADVIRGALDDDEAVRLRVRGSLPLYEALKAKLPQYENQLDFTETVNFDLSVTIDDSVFETRLAEWSAALAEAMA